ncbi:hypothetical protein AVEN_248709-1 [Araneus ventricosus]|uniref:Uncharacterized protein n=1 Tax=Araneus ventricosus TaxID=182803 RepID=A0A4Y2PEX6_ARAVE|nr:hypothetical protein AVEN_248709-1 [Araneus ventricosus]
MLVERLSPRWSSTGLTRFLGRPGQCGYFCTTPMGGRVTTYLCFNVQQALSTLDLQWNRVSNPKLSDPEALTLPLGHRSRLVLGLLRSSGEVAASVPEESPN